MSLIELFFVDVEAAFAVDVLSVDEIVEVESTKPV